jgi:hypothetical protein
MKVEIGQYWAIKNGGALKATFTLVEYPQGRRTRKCQHFISGDRSWWTFPQEKITRKDNDKPEYIAYVSYLDKLYDQELKDCVLAALKEHIAQETNGQTNAHQKQATPLQDDASPLWFG